MALQRRVVPQLLRDEGGPRRGGLVRLERRPDGAGLRAGRAERLRDGHGRAVRPEGGERPVRPVPQAEVDDVAVAAEERGAPEGLGGALGLEQRGGRLGGEPVQDVRVREPIAGGEERRERVAVAEGPQGVRVRLRRRGAQREGEELRGGEAAAAERHVALARGEQRAGARGDRGAGRAGREGGGGGRRRRLVERDALEECGEDVQRAVEAVVGGGERRGDGRRRVDGGAEAGEARRRAERGGDRVAQGPVRPARHFRV